MLLTKCCKEPSVKNIIWSICSAVRLLNSVDKGIEGDDIDSVTMISELTSIRHTTPLSCSFLETAVLKSAPLTVKQHDTKDVLT